MTRDELKLLDEYLSARRRVIEDYRGAAVALDTALAVPASFTTEQVENRMETLRRAKARYEEEFGAKLPIGPPLPPSSLTPDEEDALVCVERGGGIFGPKRKHLILVTTALRRVTGL